MPRRRALRIGFAWIVAAGALLGLAAMPAGSALAASSRAASSSAASSRAAGGVLATVTLPEYACYYPITSPFYCSAQTQNGNAPLFKSSGALYTTLPLNDKVYITCYYSGNPPSPWKGDGYEDHVTWENIAHPITGHIPDHYVNLDGQVPWQVGLPQC